MQKCLFLDRDGVINHDSGYTYKVEDLKLIDGIIQTCKLAINSGYIIIIVTNQAGIAKGRYTETDFWLFMDAIYNAFKTHDITISKTYFCPYHPEGIIEKYKKHSEDRKPNPGMILKAVQEFNIDLSQSILIGDSVTDIQAANAAGVKTAILLTNSTHDIDKYRRIF